MTVYAHGNRLSATLQQWSYDSYGNVSGQIDTRGNSWAYQHDIRS